MPTDNYVPGALPDAKARWRAATRIRRAVVLIGAVGMIAGVGLLTAGFALATGVGGEPGNLVLNPSSGALNKTPTWSTTDACPAGNNTSAQLGEFNPDGTQASLISPAVGGVTSAFSGTLDGSVGALLGFAGVTASNPGTLEWAIGCWNGPGGTGTVKYVQ